MKSYALPSAAFLLLALAAPAHAEGGGGADGVLAAPTRTMDPFLPPPPPALTVTEEEHAQLLKGEVVLRTVKVSDDERWAEAIYLFDATPTEVFDLVTDPPTQQDMIDELEVYEMVKRHPNGLETHGIANASWILPNFEYWLRTHSAQDKVWNAWGQIRGDFDANNGYWRFVWDPEREKTIGALTLHLAFKGILSLVPESWIVGLQKSSMPKSMTVIQERVHRVRKETPEVAEARQTEWRRLLAAGAGADRPLRIASN